MKADVLFTGVAVSEFGAARAWYERFFGRGPDLVAHAEEVLWQVTAAGWLYLRCDTERAGNSLVAMAVPDIDGAASQLAARGISTGAIEQQGDAGRKACVQDPDGNRIELIQVA